MKSWSIGFLAVAAFFLAALPHLHLHTAPDLQRDVINATVRVELPKGVGTGSGTVISSRRVITNHHVIVGARDEPVRVRGWIREGERMLPVFYTARVIASDVANDLALLELDDDWVGAIAVFARSEPRLGGEVCKSGAPLGKRVMVACGIVGGIDEHVIGGVQHFVTMTTTFPGDSGGGVHAVEDGRYRMVAVTRAIPVIGMGMAQTTMNYAVPLSVVRAFVDSAS